MQLLPERRLTLIGALAFAVLVLAAFSQFLFTRRIESESWRVAATFLLGAAYVAIGILSPEHARQTSRTAAHVYFLVQVTIVTAAIWLSPVRGLFFLIAMPLASESVIDYGWRGAAVVTGWLFVVSVTAIWIPFGASIGLQALTTYFPAFLFTLVCSAIAKEASLGKHRAEQMSAELTTANTQLRAHAAQAEELATTRERNRLAREIHDGLGHYLTVIKVQLDAASALLPSDPPRAAASIAQAARLAGEALDDVRRSVGTLAADATRPPLVELLRKLATDAQPSATLHIEGTPRPLTAAAEHAIYRTAQEGLTNVRKHANATAVILTLDFRQPACVRLAVADDGRGLASPPGPEGNRYGLRGLRERVALLGGALASGAQPGGGFRLEVEVPA